MNAKCINGVCSAQGHPVTKCIDYRKYDFVLVRSGDGEVFKIGQGTLEQGETLIKKMDADFDAGKEVHEAFEGSDIYAELEGKPIFLYTDKWEDWKD